MKNYYQVLNLKPNATEAEIKRSYRVLAKRYHPDVNPNDAASADRFADIGEAYNVLSDPQQRAEYDAKLKEAAAPKPNREEIIARQRAAAQAAARQAAMRNNYVRPQRIDPTMMAQRAAAQAAAQARAQAQAAQAQVAQAQSYQAQMSAVKNQAYKSGYDYGVAEARAAAEKAAAKLNSEIRALNARNRKLSGELADVENDRSELEQELFNRDRELTQEKARNKELEDQIAEMRQTFNAARNNSKQTAAEVDAMRAQLEKAQAKVKEAEQARDKAELKNKAQIQLQQDKRKQLQSEIELLKMKILGLTEELDAMRAENEQWRQYAKSEEFISDAEKRLQEWDKKQKADKKLAKSTLYGSLGVLIWASEKEIRESYAKLLKRYSAKTDDNTLAKLKKLQDAYAILSDSAKRREYNSSIGITDERIAQERAEISDNEKMKIEYREQLESKEFWAKFDELSFNAQTGDADSQNRIGEMYYYGDEVEQDLDQAVYWFKEAAKQKHADAMYNLGVCFVNGEGVEKNKTTGLGFIRQAAKLGSELALQYTAKASGAHSPVNQDT